MINCVKQELGPGWGIAWLPFIPANEKGIDIMMQLLGGFFHADEGYIYLLPALGAGDVDCQRLLHYPLGDHRYDGIDIIQTPVKHIKAL